MKFKAQVIQMLYPEHTDTTKNNTYPHKVVIKKISF